MDKGIAKKFGRAYAKRYESFKQFLIEQDKQKQDELGDDYVHVVLEKSKAAKAYKEALFKKKNEALAMLKKANDDDFKVVKPLFVGHCGFAGLSILTILTQFERMPNITRGMYAGGMVTIASVWAFSILRRCIKNAFYNLKYTNGKKELEKINFELSTLSLYPDYVEALIDANKSSGYDDIEYDEYSMRNPVSPISREYMEKLQNLHSELGA